MTAMHAVGARDVVTSYRVRALVCILAYTALGTGCQRSPLGPTSEPPPPPTTGVGPPRVEVTYHPLGPIISIPTYPYDEGNIIVTLWGDLTGILERPLAHDDALEGGRIVVTDRACWSYQPTICPPSEYGRPYGNSYPRAGSISTRIGLMNLVVDLTLHAETARGARIRLMPTREHVTSAYYEVHDGRITRDWR